MVSFNQEFNIHGLPPQKLSSKMKNKEWVIRCVNGVVSMSGDTGKYGRPSKLEMQDNYDIINSIFDSKKMEYLTNPSNLSDKQKIDLGGMPTVLRMHNIIRPKLELLAGEEGKKMFNWVVIGEDGGVINDKVSAKEQDILEALQRMLMSDEEISLEDIDKKHKVAGIDIRERNCQRLIEKIWRDQNLKQKFSKGFKHASISAHEIYYVSKHKGKPHCRVVNPMNFEFDKNPDLDFIEDGDWAREEREMTISSIIDTYGEFLTEEEVDRLDKGLVSDMSAYNNSTYLPQITEMPIYDSQANQIGSEWVNFGKPGSVDLMGGSPNNYTNRKLRVHTTVWRSYRRLGFLTDPEGNENIIEDDSFTLTSELKRAGYTLQWEYVTDIWKGTKIGEDIYVDYGPLENQTGKLPYVGYIYNNLNSKAQSLVDIVKEHQYTYMEIWYKLMMEVAKAKGKKILMDTAQIPSDMSPERWLYWYDIVGIAWINSFEEGTEGSTTGQRSSFNQQQLLDQSLSNSVNNYILMLDKVERMIGDVLGVSEQREGAISSNETVGGVERSVAQSSLITEPFFIQHNEVKKNVLSQLLNVALLCVLDEDSPIQLMVDDSFVEMLMLDGKQLNDSKYRVEITDSIEDTALVEKLKGLAQAALQNDQASLSSIGMLFRNKSASDILGKLREWEQAKQEREQALQQQQAQLEQARIDAEERRYQSELEYKKEKDQLDRENKVQIAVINAMRSKDGPTDMDGDGIPDPVEVGKLYLEQSKLSAQQAEVTHKMGLEAAKGERESHKLQLEAEKLKADIEEKQAKLNLEQQKLFMQSQQMEIDKAKMQTELQLQANETNQQNQHKLMDSKDKEKDRQLKLKELEKKEKIEKYKIRSKPKPKASTSKPKKK